jgi:rSAM/selenodomain-associated transferase 2/rSAM/selenodomain-associated transferase 1
MPSISIVIPVYREVNTIRSAIERLTGSPDYSADIEIIVVDGDKKASTIKNLHSENVITIKSERGRGVQLNAGAKIARGGIILFLHADTELPAGAFGRVKSVFKTSSADAGAFSLGIDSNLVFFRFIEAAANIRCYLSGIPYGDQGIFIKKEVFDNLGGFPDIPIMEDVEFMMKLKKKGFRVMILKERVSTSPRRWEKDGYLRTLFNNRLISVLYFLGVKPEILAGIREKGQGNALKGVIVFIKYPQAGYVKSRIGTLMGDGFTAGLYRNFVADILKKLKTLPYRIIIYFTPSNRESDIIKWLGPHYEFLPQKGSDLGKRMKNAFAEQFAMGYSELLLIGSDIPHLPPAWIKRAFSLIGEKGAVIGPSVDGGYYLIGFRFEGFLPEVFDGINWGESTVFESTEEVFLKNGTIPGKLPVMIDIDTPDDLRSVINGNPAGGFKTPFTAVYLRQNRENFHGF